MKQKYASNELLRFVENYFVSISWKRTDLFDIFVSDSFQSDNKYRMDTKLFQYANAALALQKALMTGNFSKFSSMLSPDVILTLAPEMTVMRLVNVISFWQDWRYRNIISGKVKCLELGYCRHLDRQCLVADHSTAILFQMENDLICNIVMTQV